MKLVIALLMSSVSATKLDTQAKVYGDGDAAVAKTAAIKNIQKALTARILKRLDDGQPLVEVARKMKAIEGMQPQINDMERRLGIMQSVEPVLENAIKTLQKVVDVRGMGKKTLLQLDQEVNIDEDKKSEETIELIVSDFGKGPSNKHRKHHVQTEEDKKDNLTQSVAQKPVQSTAEQKSNNTQKLTLQEQNEKILQARTGNEDSDALQAFTDSVVEKNVGSIAQKSSNSSTDTIVQANTTSNITANSTANETSPESDNNAQTSTKGIGAAAAMAQESEEAEQKEADQKKAKDDKAKKKEKAAKDAKKVEDEKKAEEGEEMKEKKEDKKDDKKKDEKKEQEKKKVEKKESAEEENKHVKELKKLTAGFKDDPSDFDEHYQWETSF